MQTTFGIFDQKIQQLCLPDREEWLMPGVKWGAFDQLFTPAYWASQLWLLSDNPSVLTYKLGRTLKEETAACMLGGYGIPAEMALAAYDTLRNQGFLRDTPVTEREIASALKQQMSFDGRLFHYRFPNIKARFLAPALNSLNKELPATNDHKTFRNWFLRFAGVGMKTASWITRNWLSSSEVAILDIHVVRCGRMIRLFSKKHDPARNYPEMEILFLDFCGRLGVDADKLDVLMWQQMRTANSLGLRVFNFAA